MRSIIEITIFEKTNIIFRQIRIEWWKCPKPRNANTPSSYNVRNNYPFIILSYYWWRKKSENKAKKKTKNSIYNVFLNIWDSLKLVETQFTVCFWTFENLRDSLRLNLLCVSELETPWDSLRLDLLCVSEHLRLLETRWGPQKLMVMMCFETLDMIGRPGVL